MATLNYANDKFIPAPLPAICAPRRKLIELYDKASNNRLTVVCAPAGYGKTVSTLLWVSASKRKSVWIDLDEYDNAPFVFYKLFCTGILSAQPDNVKMQEILNSKAFYSAPVDYTINLLMEFTQDEESYALILDDLHTITNKKILKSLPYILKRMPHSFVILLLSRNKLPDELQEFAQSRSSAVITADELAFSAEEIETYYDALGRKPTESQAETILKTTGGWAIGITALSKSDSLEASQVSGQFLEHYINRNIWEKWEPELREFMLVTSVANEMDAELCNLLTGRKNAAEILENLLLQNLFAVKTSEHTYRYHHLFLEFLRGKLNERPDISVRELMTKVAGVYYDREEYFTALTYYVQTENHDGINRCFYQLNSIYQDFSVEEWINYTSTFVLEKLPNEFIHSNITLMIEAAWANFLNGNAKAALLYIDAAYDYVASDNNQDILQEEDLLGYALTIGFADFRKGLHEFAEEFSDWSNALPEKSVNDLNMYTPSITQNFPYMHRSICDCLDVLVDMVGRLQEIHDVFGSFYTREVDVFCTCVQSGLYYEQNKLEKASEAITLAQSQLTEELRFEMHFCVYMLLSNILNALGKSTESEKLREQFAMRLREENALYLNPNFLAVDTKNKLLNADLETAKEWLEQLFVTDDEHLRFYRLYQYFTTARAYIVLSEREKAEDLLKKLKKLCVDYRRPIDVAEVCVLQACLYWATGSQKAAMQILEEALLAMQPYRVIRIIADEGAAVLPILKKITFKIERPKYSGELDCQYVNQVLQCAYEVSRRHKGISAYLHETPIKLSQRQQYILTLLAQGYKNADIVSISGLTINTIKTHIKLIYEKLGVNKAADAVMEAKRRGLIES
ncbi:LuxR C-terminal-related transcriptional regulator [Desulfosporosinus sp. FKA]|uniref:LuxR C-terminal-related transcriptional regulator n=1 Tax=Desulfosporosinus sp. FKA TaxID=1969834 RepID=UPI000B4A0CF8|nr:LuxR C-terminal-related transcriptional regulator [Desulfosporosinus sp. FKA]